MKLSSTQQRETPVQVAPPKPQPTSILARPPTAAAGDAAKKPVVERRTRIALPPLRIEKCESHSMPDEEGDDMTNRVVYAENHQHNGIKYGRVKLKAYEDNRVVWDKVLTQRVTSLAVSNFFIAVTCEDNYLYLFLTSTGRLLHTPLITPGESTGVQSST